MAEKPDSPDQIVPPNNGIKPYLVFISHDTRDAELAKEFAELLSKSSAGILKTFRSSDKSANQGIEYGSEWYQKVMARLDEASDVVCLITTRSLGRPWILYEAGVAKGKRATPVHAVALGIPIRTAIDGPFAQFQNCDGKEESLTQLVAQLVGNIPDSAPDTETIAYQVKRFLHATAPILTAMDQTIEGPDSPQETETNSAAKFYEEIKVIVQDLPSRLPVRNPSSMEPSVTKEFFHLLNPVSPKKTVNPAALLISASRYAGIALWLHDFALALHDAHVRQDKIAIYSLHDELIAMRAFAVTAPYYADPEKNATCMSAVAHLASLSKQIIMSAEEADLLSDPREGASLF